MLKTPNQEVQLPLLTELGVTLVVKREDTMHPVISGNKYRKLKYNLIEAQRLKHDTLLTFGGAYSNHIVATACLGNENGLQTIGVIRGEELRDSWQDNPTLKKAASYGMQFYFVNRTAYRQKESKLFLKTLEAKFGLFYKIPEGGTNRFAIQGCEEILEETDSSFDLITAAVGTGGTLAGLVNASHPNQKVLGFSALKGDFLKEDIRKFAKKSNWQLISGYHFGGYAKVNTELVTFMNTFKKNTGIPLDPIYTGKMVFGVLDMVKTGKIKPNSRVLAIHTGGLQGIFGMNRVLANKNLPLIDL